MDKKKIFLITGLLLVVAGVIIGWFANFALADITSFALTMFGAGLAAAAMWDKRDTGKQSWLSILSIAFIGAGSFLLAFGGITEGTVTTIITSVFGIIAIIASIILASVANQPTSGTAEIKEE